MNQALLFPDARPLVERLGVAFFRGLPERPGVYLMRDAAEQVLYVGKAKNLRKRLGSYRVANPDRMPRRHLRLLRAVARIEVQECADELAALSRESELLRGLRPRFNRAGVWPGPPRHLLWRVVPGAVEFAIAAAPDGQWHGSGPLGLAAEVVRAALARLVWGVFHSPDDLTGMPHAWFHGRHGPVCSVPCAPGTTPEAGLLEQLLEALFTGTAEPFAEWVRERTACWRHPFVLAVREADLETAVDFSRRQAQPKRQAYTTPSATSRDPATRAVWSTPDLFLPL